MLNDYLASDPFEDKFTNTFTVPVASISEAEWMTLDVEYPDGVIATLSLEAQSEESKAALADSEFEICYSDVDGEEPKSMKFYSDSEPAPLSFMSKSLRIKCSAGRAVANIPAVGHEGKLKRTYDHVKYALVGPDRRSFFAVTESEIHYETPNGSKKVDLPEALDASELRRLTKIALFGTSYVFETNTGAIFSSDPALADIESVGGVRVVKRVHREHIRAYILSNGTLHYQGLWDNFGVAGNDVHIDTQPLVELDAPARLEGYAEGDMIADL